MTYNTGNVGKKRNGKGSKPRPYKVDTYTQNFDDIDWGNKNNKNKKNADVDDAAASE